MNHMKVMYYLNDAKKEKQILKLCSQQGIQTRKIKEKDVNVPLSTLAGISGVVSMTRAEKAPKDYEIPELLIFVGMSDGTLDEFLAEYRKQGIEPISLKATVTPHNISWSVYQLTVELIRERASIFMGNL